jgi:hypothetical protein
MRFERNAKFKTLVAAVALAGLTACGSDDPAPVAEETSQSKRHYIYGDGRCYRRRCRHGNH